MANKSTKRSSSGWSLNKVSMWILVAAALLYVVAMILSLVGGINFVVISALQNIAEPADTWLLRHIKYVCLWPIPVSLP